MLDAKRLLDQFLGGQDGKGGAGEFMKGAGGGALAGGLAAILLGSKTGRNIGGEALKLGGMAAVGALAYKAYRDWQAGKEAPAAAPARESVPMLPAPSGTPFNPSSESGQQTLARHLLRAMIAAAKADGHVDDDERKKIADKLKLAGIGAEAEKFLLAELESPLDLDTLVAGAKTDAQKLELYTASRLTIDPDTRAERGYLDLLAGRLGLPDALVDHVEATVSAAKVPAGNAPSSPW